MLAAGADVVALQEVMRHHGRRVARCASRRSRVVWTEARRRAAVWGRWIRGARAGHLFSRAWAMRRGPSGALCVRVGRRRDRQPPLPDRAGAGIWPRCGCTRRSRPTSPGRPAPCVLCGDLNTPRRELPDGDAHDFADDTPPRPRPPARRSAGTAPSAALVPRPRLDRRLPRRCTATASASASWTFSGRPRRLAARSRARGRACAAVAAAYAHDWRRAGLSDHSALIADLEPH